MQNAKIVVVFMSFLLIICNCNIDTQEFPVQESDKVIKAIIAHNRTLDPLRGTDDIYFINIRGDSTILSFAKKEVRTSHVDRKPDFGILYTSRQNNWAYYVVKESKYIYTANYITMDGKFSLLYYRVNTSSGVIEIMGL